MSVIKAEEVSKIYNANTPHPVYALNKVSIAIEKGEFTTIVGPSGSGKTTLLNVIGGLDKPTLGKVYIENTNIAGLSPQELVDFRLHHIGFVFQAYNLIPVLTAFENATFVMLLQGRPKEEIAARGKEILQQVGLAERLDAKPAELSGGQQQRVAVARALASKPKFILADEPTANLDTDAAFNLLDIMQKMNEEEQVTFIFSTHDQRVIKRARRVITLVDGALHSDVRQ